MRVSAKNPIKQHHVFLRYLISYCLVLLVPLFLGSLAFLQTSRDLEKRVLDDVRKTIDHRVSLLDQRLQELDNFVAQLTLDNRINSFLSVKSPLQEGSAVWAVYELQEALSPYRLVTSFIDTFHLSFATSQTVITPNYSFVEMKFFYDHFFRFGDQSAEDWFGRLFGSFHQKTVVPSQTVDFGTKQYRALTYIQSLPANRSAINRGVLALFIPEDEFLLHLRGIHEDHIVIRDSDGEVLISTLPEDHFDITGSLSLDSETLPLEYEVDGIRNVVFSVVSEYNAWRYYIVSPKQSIGAQIKATRRTLWLILSLAIVVGLVIAYLMAYRRSKPIERLAALLKGQTDGADTPDLKYIEGSIANLIERDRDLQKTVDSQRPLLQARFLEGLIKGTFESQREIDAYRRETGLPLIPARSVTVVFRWGGLSKHVEDSHHSMLQVRTALIRKTIQQQFGANGLFFYDLDFDHVAVIIASSEAEWDEAFYRRGIAESVSTIITAVSESAPQDRLVVGVGSPALSNVDIAVSTRTALEAVEYMPLSREDPIVWHADIPQEGQPRYPYKTATRIMNAVKSGDTTLARQLASEVYSSNFVDSTLSAEALRQLRYDIRDTLQKLMNWVNGNDQDGDLHRAMVQFDASVTVEDMFERFSSMLASIGRSAEKSKKSHNEELRDAIVEYVEANFQNSDLYLPTVAERFRITKEYLSHFFKEQTGENFSVYLENLRIEYAILMMNENGAAITQVAADCGYKSPQVFRRAFKRVTGSSPREYRLQSDS